MDVRLGGACGVFALALAVRVVAQEPAAALSITVHKGRMTCIIRTAPLSQVLEVLAEQTGATFVPTEAIRGDEITLEMTDAPLEAGLRRLLRRYDTFVYYAASGDAPSSLRAVWIYPKGLGAALQPVPQESFAVAHVQQRLSDASPRVREEAYAALVVKNDEASREFVVNAVRGATEPDDRLRERLLTETINQGMKLPTDVLTDLVRTDASEMIRLRALDALADDPAGVEAASSAVADPSPRVRKRAQQILEANQRRP